jgi:hypothetical protein
MNYSDLLMGLDNAYRSPDFSYDDFEKIRDLIDDNDYLKFIKQLNGGFFYSGALQIYSICRSPDFTSIFCINEIVKKEYQGIIDQDIFFAQEIFGNQFGFSSNGIVFFNIETGEKQIIAKGFDDWCKVIEADLEYFSGKAFLTSWNNVNKKLKYNERLCAKIPFVIGGEYNVKNLYTQVFPEFIKSNANIAKQIYSLPDGAPIKLKIVD